MKPESGKIQCPKCGQYAINALVFRSYLAASISSDDTGKKIKYHQSGEDIKLLTGCENCGLTKSQILNPQIDRQRLLERLRKQGLPTQISG